MSAIQQLPELPIAEPLRADLAEMDVVLCAGLIRGKNSSEVPEPDRIGAKTLRDHYEKILSIAPPPDDVHVGASAAFRDARYTRPRPNEKSLLRAITLLRQMESGDLPVASAKELLDCIADVHFGTPVE